MGDEFEDVYDDITRRALDRWSAPTSSSGPEVARGWRAGLGATAFMTAAALGVQDVLEPKQRTPIIEEIDLDSFGLGDDVPVTYIHVPGVPRASRAIVRPWLFNR
ncbi:MAG TPA: hypothetical protein VFV00_02680 [Acidimicrobiales bacterium]|nr:hypothetical protein [Acidimicrobiales bacterium]